MRRELSHLNPIERLAAQIIDRLDCLGSRTSKRELERSMSAHKRPLWDDAWEMLIQDKCIQLTAEKRRQQFIALINIPTWSEVKPIVTKRRRKRPPSPWFKFLLPIFLDRDGYEEKAAKAMDALERDCLK